MQCGSIRQLGTVSASPRAARVAFVHETNDRDAYEVSCPNI